MGRGRRGELPGCPPPRPGLTWGAHLQAGSAGQAMETGSAPLERPLAGGEISLTCFRSPPEVRAGHLGRASPKGRVCRSPPPSRGPFFAPTQAWRPSVNEHLRLGPRRVSPAFGSGAASDGPALPGSAALCIAPLWQKQSGRGARVTKVKSDALVPRRWNFWAPPSNYLELQVP